MTRPGATAIGVPAPTVTATTGQMPHLWPTDGDTGTSSAGHTPPIPS
jgi:hypothetical protein